MGNMMDEASGGMDLASLLSGGGEGATTNPAPNAGEGDPVELVRKAIELVDAAKTAEPDDEDTVLLEKVTTELQTYIANQQKLVDTATGAGPGAKVIRKAQARGGGAAPAGGGGGGY